MSWFNYYGLAVIIIMMIPNIIDAKCHPEHFENKFQNKTLELLEQIGRIGTFGLMVFNIPGLYVGFWFDGGELIYILVNAALLLLYLSGWLIFRKNQSVVRAVWLSVTPSLIFVFSGIMLVSYPLIVLSILFAVCHITISVNNASSHG